MRTGTSHEIPNYIRYLAVPIIPIIPLTSVEAENMFSQLKIVKTILFTHMFQNILSALITTRDESNSFKKIKETEVDKLRNTKQRII